MSENAIDEEARRLARIAYAKAESAMLQADNAVAIARTANNVSLENEATIRAGFLALGEKQDATRDDIRDIQKAIQAARAGGSIRPRIDTLSETDEAIRQELANVRAELDKRTASLEAERESRERADAARVKAEAARRRSARKLAWAVALGAATTLGGILVTGAVYEARRVADHHAAPDVRPGEL